MSSRWTGAAGHGLSQNRADPPDEWPGDLPGTRTAVRSLRSGRGPAGSPDTNPRPVTREHHYGALVPWPASFWN